VYGSKVSERKVCRVVLVTFWIVFAGVFVLRGVPEVRAGNTWIVDNTGGGDFLTISAALSSSSVMDGDTIFVRYGTGMYIENLVVNKKVNIVGELQQNVNPPTISSAQPDTHVIEITTYPVLIENFKITGATGLGVGVYSEVAAEEYNEVTLQNLEIYSNVKGIVINYVNDGGQSVIPSYHVIDSCSIHDNYFSGIEIYGENHRIRECEIYNNYNGILSVAMEGEGGYLSYTEIEDCEVWGNGGDGIHISESNYNRIKGTDVWNNDHEGIFLSGDHNAIEGVGSGQLSSIYDNNQAGSLAIWDLHVSGEGNIIKYYKIYQSTHRQNTRGVFIVAEEGESNIIENCEVFGYYWSYWDGGEEKRGYGIFLLSEGGVTEIRGSDTKIYDNYVGVVTSNSGDVIDLGSYNNYRSGYGIFNNWMGVSCGDYTEIKNAYFFTTSGWAYQYYADVYAASHVKIEGCKFAHFALFSNVGRAIYIGDGVHSVSVRDCIFNRYYIEIELYHASYNSIQDCTFSSYHQGIYLSSSSTYNEIVRCNFFGAIAVYNNDPSVYASVVIRDFSDHNYVNDSSFDIPNADSAGKRANFVGIYINGSEYNEINNCEFFNKTGSDYDDDGPWTNGIWCAYYSDDNDILGCDFENLDRAVVVESSQEIDIFGDDSSNSDMKYCAVILYAYDPLLYAAKGRIKNYNIQWSSSSNPFNKPVRIDGHDCPAMKSRFEYHTLNGPHDAYINDDDSEWVETTGW